MNIPHTLIWMLAAVLGLAACSQKPTAEEIAAQVKLALEQEKAKEATAPASAVVPEAAPTKKTEPVSEVAPSAKAEAAHQAAPKREAAAKHQAAPAPVAGVMQPVAPPCPNCGVVVAVNTVEEAGKGSGLGVVAGGVVGGLVGNQVGDGTGRQLATLAGVVGGALAGNAIEKNVKKTRRYDIVVKMEDGSERTYHQAAVPAVANGDKVRIENDTVVKN